MSTRVLILGANGRCGRATVHAFTKAQWRVRTLSRRKPSRELASETIEVFQGDALQPDTLHRAADGADVIINAVNPPYRYWHRDVPTLTANCLAAARSSGATIIVPGNVYPFGSSMPALLEPTTPLRPDTALGQIRADLENAYRQASTQDQQIIMLRAGDYIEGRRTGNWFEDHVLARLDKGIVTYPGPLDRKHAWAWLPDFAQVMVKLAERRTALDQYESIGFPGWALTGAELIALLERLKKQPLTVNPLPWPILKLASLFSADLRGVVSLRYLWEADHQIDETRLKQLLPDFEPVPPEEGLAMSLSRLLEEKRSRADEHRCRPVT